MLYPVEVYGNSVIKSFVKVDETLFEPDLVEVDG